jgi:stage II sporulation protein AA (anti-sigma F factor antagonist)
MYSFDEGASPPLWNYYWLNGQGGDTGLTVKVEEKDGVLVAWLSGELDHHAADDVRRQLDTALYRREPRKVVLDMSKLTFMDSAGIGVVLGRYKKLKEAGGRLAVRGFNGRVDRILKLAGVYTVVDRE